MNASAPGTRQLAGQTIAVCMQGLFLQELGGIDQLDPRPVIDLVVRAAVAAG